MADSSESQVSVDGEQVVSESQIAVHWREEEYYFPPESFVAQANAADPGIFDRFGLEEVPGVFHRVCGSAGLGPAVGHGAGQ